MKKQTDDLVKRAKRHESEAFTELMQLYMTDMYKVAYPILMMKMLPMQSEIRF